MSHLLLSHLSRDNNDPKLVEDLFNAHAGKTKIVVASRYVATEVFYISHDTAYQQPAKPVQIALFA